VNHAGAPLGSGVKEPNSPPGGGILAKVQ